MDTQLIINAPIKNPITTWKWTLYINNQEIGTLKANKDFVLNVPSQFCEIYFKAFKGQNIRTSDLLKTDFTDYAIVILEAILYMKNSIISQQYSGQFARLRIKSFLGKDGISDMDKKITISITAEQLEHGEEIIIKTPQGNISYKLKPNMNLNKTYRFRGQGFTNEFNYHGDLYVQFIVSNSTETTHSNYQIHDNIYSAPTVICLSSSSLIDNYLSTLVYMDYVIDKFENKNQLLNNFTYKNINLLYIIDIWQSVNTRTLTIVETLNNDVTFQKIFFDNVTLISLSLKENEKYKKIHISIYTCNTEEDENYILNREVTFSMSENSVKKYIDIFDAFRMGFSNNQYNVKNLQDFVNTEKFFTLKQS